MRKKIIAGNWKMNLGLEEGITLFSELRKLIQEEVSADHKIVVCPPFTHIQSLANMLESDDKLFVGAQNCHQADNGAFTGEISAAMLASAGAEYVIIGHSERRLYFAESNADLEQKIRVAIKYGLRPIFCIGETLEQRNNGTFFEVIKSQISEVAFRLSDIDFEKLILAYEPVWAIGTGLTASPEQAQEIHAYLRNLVSENYNPNMADQVSILYGGSCNPKNASDLFAKADIDGGLIGGASLKARDFVDIILAMDQK